MEKGKKDIRPLLLKLGVAFALSFAGFFYSRFRIKRVGGPSSSSSSGESRDTGGREQVPTTPTFVDSYAAADSLQPKNYEEASHQKINIDNSAPQYASSKKHSGDDEPFLLPEFNDLALNDFEVPSSNTVASPRVDTPTSLRRAAEKEMEQEIISLRNMVRIHQERERKLEMQLLEYYGMKEQETAVMELQNRLKINNMEAKLFTLKIQSLEADNQRLEAKVADYAKVMGELESAKMKIKVLKRKIRSEGELTREQLATLEQKVANLQDQDGSGAGEEDIKKSLQKLKQLEEESAELRVANTRLQNENSELARRLEYTQIDAASVLEHPGIESLQENNRCLKQENDNLKKEIERLQENRSADVEELVYLRWVNACLRYELRNYDAPPGKTVARDLSKTLSPKSEEKAKKLILEYANYEGMSDKGISLKDFDLDYWSSSQDSNRAESVEYDESSVDASSATRTTNSSKSKILNKLMKLVRGKESPKSNQSSLVDSRPTTSYAASGRGNSVSTSSYEEMVGTYAGSTISSQNSSSLSSADLMTIEARSDERRSKLMLPSQMPRPSLDINRIRNQSLADIKNMEHARRNSDVGSSYGYKRLILREESGSSLEQENLHDQDQGASEKSELMKFAEVLKGSNASPKSHRRVVSYSSY